MSAPPPFPAHLHWDGRRAGGTFHLVDTRTWAAADFAAALAWKADPDRHQAWTCALGDALAAAIRRLLGGHPLHPGDLQLVVPPAGHRRETTHPAGALAAEVGRLLDLDVVTALARTAPTRGGRGRLAAPPRYRQTIRLPGWALVLDDVTTTGGTLAAARDALEGPSIGVAAIAWHAAAPRPAGRRRRRPPPRSSHERTDR